MNQQVMINTCVSRFILNKGIQTYSEKTPLFIKTLFHF